MSPSRTCSQLPQLVLAPDIKPTRASEEMHADFLRKCGKLARRAAKAAAPKNVVQHSTNAQPCVLAESLKPRAADGNLPSAPASTLANARAASNAPPLAFSQERETTVALVRMRVQTPS